MSLGSRVTMLAELPGQRWRQLCVNEESHALRSAEDGVIRLRCCVLETRLDVIGLEVRVIRKDLGLAGA